MVRTTTTQHPDWKWYPTSGPAKPLVLRRKVEHLVTVDDPFCLLPYARHCVKSAVPSRYGTSRGALASSSLVPCCRRTVENDPNSSKPQHTHEEYYAHHQLVNLQAQRASEGRGRWTNAEKAALRAGVTKHGTKWVDIKNDASFQSILGGRSAQKCKDQWRKQLCTEGVHVKSLLSMLMNQICHRAGFETSQAGCTCWYATELTEC